MIRPSKVCPSRGGFFLLEGEYREKRVWVLSGEASLLGLIKNLNSGVIYLLDKCYITSALSFDTLAQVLYTGIALFLSGRYPPIIKLN